MLDQRPVLDGYSGGYTGYGPKHHESAFHAFVTNPWTIVLLLSVALVLALTLAVARRVR
jgi:hypothetical protein